MYRPIRYDYGFVDQLTYNCQYSTCNVQPIFLRQIYARLRHVTPNFVHQVYAKFTPGLRQIYARFTPAYAK